MTMEQQTDNYITRNLCFISP